MRESEPIRLRSEQRVRTETREILSEIKWQNKGEEGAGMAAGSLSSLVFVDKIADAFPDLSPDELRVIILDEINQAEKYALSSYPERGETIKVKMNFIRSYLKPEPNQAPDHR